MAKKVFFSFHYQDVIDFRANVVRNHATTKYNQAGYFDKSIWEEAQKTSPLALKRLINSALIGTSVTCVLIGSLTYQRPWVRYEIFRSIYQGKNLLGVHINGIKCKDSKIKDLGPNPFDYTGIYFNEDGGEFAFIIKKLNKDKKWQWFFWKEIDSKQFHKNDYFKKEYAKTNAKKCVSLNNIFSTYDWVADDGYNNFNKWIE